MHAQEYETWVGHSSVPLHVSMSCSTTVRRNAIHEFTYYSSLTIRPRWMKPYVIIHIQYINGHRSTKPGGAMPPFHMMVSCLAASPCTYSLSINAHTVVVSSSVLDSVLGGSKRCLQLQVKHGKTVLLIDINVLISTNHGIVILIKRN